MTTPPVPEPDGHPRRRGPRRRTAVIAMAVVVVAALTVTFVLLGQGDDEVAGRAAASSPQHHGSTPRTTHSSGTSTPAATESPEPGSSSSRTGVPGWQTVTIGTVSYDVPPTWTIRDFQGPDGRTLQEGVYRPGYCNGRKTVLADVVATISDIQPASKSVRSEVSQRIEQLFGSREHEVEWGKLKKSDDDMVAVVYATVRFSRSDRCQAKKALVLGRAWSNTDGPGGDIFLVVADQGVPHAESVENLEKIVNSFRDAEG